MEWSLHTTNIPLWKQVRDQSKAWFDVASKTQQEWTWQLKEVTRRGGQTGVDMGKKRLKKEKGRGEFWEVIQPLLQPGIHYHLIHATTDQVHLCVLVFCFFKFSTIRDNLLPLKDHQYRVSRHHKWCVFHLGRNPSAVGTTKSAHREGTDPGELSYLRFLNPVPSPPFWDLVTSPPKLTHSFSSQDGSLCYFVLFLPLAIKDSQNRNTSHQFTTCPAHTT